MAKPNPTYGRGDVAIFNKTREFGNDYDCLFHIHSRRYGTCTGDSENRWWYSGYLFKMEDSGSKGLPQIPVFATTLTNTSEESMKGLEHLILK